MTAPQSPLSAQEKKKELFFRQKELLDTFLANKAITRAQYDKSYGDLVKKMGMEEAAASPAPRKKP